MALDLTKLAQRRAALESRLAHATTALRDAQRKDDTRRKIVLGSATLALIREGTAPDWLLPSLITRMSERDRLLFPDAATVSVPEFEGARS